MDPQGDPARVHAALEVNRPDLAVSLTEDLLRSTPDDASLHCLLARALWIAGDRARARESADRALALDQADPDHWYVAAVTRSGFRERREALRLVESALRIDPNHVPSHVLAAEVLALPAVTAKGRADLAAADRHANMALRLAPNAPDGYIAMSRICQARGDRSGAHWFASEAVRRDPSDAYSRSILAVAAEASGDLRSAGDHYTAAGKLGAARSSLRGLRKLRRSLPISVFALFITVRLALLAGEGAGLSRSAVLIGVAFLVGTVIAGYVVLSTLLARRELSPEAKRILADDRRHRRARLVPRVRR